MPDWSYRTVFQPVLFRLPFETARNLALGSLGRLARLPRGRTVVDLMGHMAPDDRLKTDLAGHSIAAPLMLGCSLDPHLTALPALSRFGFGLIEIGPVAPHGRRSNNNSRLDIPYERLITSDDAAPLDAEQTLHRLQRARVDRQMLVIRIAASVGEDTETTLKNCECVISGLSPAAAMFALTLSDDSDPAKIENVISRLVVICRDHGSRLIVVANSHIPIEQACQLVLKARISGADSVLIDSTKSMPDSDSSRGPECREDCRRLTRSLRKTLGPEATIIAGGGVHEPIDAVRLIEDGATMVQIDSGLIFSGPGLPKRCNDALLCQRMQAASLRPAVTRTGKQAWLWTLLLGIAMLIGGAMAMVIAVTRVVMPYDEQFVGMTRSELLAVNDRLLLFMTHDRVTLAGTMLALGTLYTLLSWCGVRRGWHWASIAVIASSFVGFMTFFAFLGFGYFDPLHAFVTAILFQFLLLGIHSEMAEPEYDDVPNLTNHSAWQFSQWGQLLWIMHGAILIVAGGVICTYGMTSVFVPEDLDFMRTTAEALCIANPQLVPLVAHDRATFGGMLIACGCTVLLASLWGFRQGNAWLWRALFLAGNIAYIAAILVHWSVGYTSLLHLLPAYGGFALLWVSAGLSRRWLCTIDPIDIELWQKQIRPTTRQNNEPAFVELPGGMRSRCM